MKGNKTQESRHRTPLSKHSKFDMKNRKKPEQEPVDHTAYAVPPWPVWNDTDINFERWDVRSSQTSFTSKDKIRSQITLQLRFEDPTGHAPMPPSLVPTGWKRLFHIPGMGVFNEITDNSPTLDLATPNAHLLHSEVMRWILAGIMNLYQLGRAHNIELEGEGQAFSVPSRPWKPWHHIYAITKMVKGTAYKPQVNSAGKYCVRLFYMGCWRRLTVDDYLPFDDENRPLLPMSSSCNEMWPALLSKALLKVAALSWTEHNEIRDFSVMACLTGWYAQELNLYKVPPRSVWWLCQKLLMSDCEDPEERFTGVKDVTVSVAYEPSSWTGHVPLLCPSIRTDNTDPEAEVLGSVVLCAVMNTFPTELLPCEEHPVLITKVRVDPSDDRPPTPLWKTFRWKDWALKEGLIADRSEKHVKLIRVYSALQKCQPDKSLGARIPSLQDIPLEKIYSSKMTRVREKDARKSGRKESKKDAKTSGRKESKKDAKTSGRKESKNQTRATTKGKLSQDNLLPEFWIEFEKIVHGIKRFEIFYKTKSFEHNLKVNDITQLLQDNVIPATPSTKSTHKNLSLTSTPPRTTKDANLKRGRADVLYFLMDSMASKKLLISLSVLKPSNYSLSPLDTKLHSSPSHQVNISSTSLSTDDTKSQPTSPPTYYILGEGHYWQSHHIHDISFTVKTVATTCHILQLKEGLQVFRLWLSLPETYAIRISSQTPFILGTRDRIQEVLTQESLSWKYYGSRFSSAFNTLANIEHDSPNHQELLENMRESYLPIKIPKPASKFAAFLRKEIHSRFEKTLMKLLAEITDSPETIATAVSEWRWLFHQAKFGSKISLESIIGDLLKVHELGTLAGSEKDISKISLLRSVGGSESQIGSYRNGDSVDAIVPLTGERTKLITFDQKSGTEFIRRMLGNDPDLLRFYPFRNDDYNNISFADYKGVVRNSTGEWIPLARFVVNVHPNTNPFCGIYLTSSLEDDVIQVVNNDTLEQIPRFLGNIEPSYFLPNRRGYTVFAYGSDKGQKQKDYNWKIRIVSVHEQQLPHLRSKSITKVGSPEEPPELTCKELTGHYMPNNENTIYKCLLTTEKSQDVTLRTVMSNKNVEFVLRISAGDADVIKEYFATGEIIVPVVQLKGRDSEGPNFYVIEAQVLRKTWTLSPEEMEIVNTLRDKIRQELLVFAEEGDSKRAAEPGVLKREKSTPNTSVLRLKRNRKMVAPIEFEIPVQKPDPLSNAPSWTLTLVMDKDNSSTVSLEKDQRRAEEIRQIKAQWEAAEPGRYQKSFQIRKEFLQQDRYSAYLRGFIHEQGVESGERTKYLLEHLSFSEGDHEPDSAEVDRKDQRRKAIEEFNNEYKEITTQFDYIRENQAERQRAIMNRLAKVTNESRNLISQAYYGRMIRVEKVIEQMEEAKRLLEMEQKAQKAQKKPSKIERKSSKKSK